MAMFPLVSNFQEDFVLQLVSIDDESSIDDLAAAAAVHSVGRRVKPRPGVLRVRRQGAEEPLPRATKVADSGLRPMECVEIYWEGSHSAVRTTV